MKITISGTAASGKSSIGKLLAEKLGFKHFSMGDFQREIAKDKGITIKELGELEAKDSSIDKMVDEKQKQIGIDNDDFVMDSWLASKFIPDAIKIFIDADPLIRAERRSKHHRAEENFTDVHLAMEDMTEREEINRKRWIEFYDFDFRDPLNYDLLIDTTSESIESATDKIIKFVKDFE